jgi:hypothetical protein
VSTRLPCVAILFLTMAAGSSLGQPPAPAAQREAMKKLDFLVGEWKGEGWMEFAPGQKRTFKGTEIVQSKLDGLLLSVEGLHRGRLGEKEDVVVHNAFGLLSYDDKARRYRFQAFTSRGNYEEAQAKVSDGQLVWGMKIPQLARSATQSNWTPRGGGSRSAKFPRTAKNGDSSSR